MGYLSKGLPLAQFPDYNDPEAPYELLNFDYYGGSVCPRARMGTSCALPDSALPQSRWTSLVYAATPYGDQDYGTAADKLYYLDESGDINNWAKHNITVKRWDPKDGSPDAGLGGATVV